MGQGRRHRRRPAPERDLLERGAIAEQPLHEVEPGELADRPARELEQLRRIALGGHPHEGPREPGQGAHRPCARRQRAQRLRELVDRALEGGLEHGRRRADQLDAREVGRLADDERQREALRGHGVVVDADGIGHEPHLARRERLAEGAVADRDGVDDGAVPELRLEPEPLVLGRVDARADARAERLADGGQEPVVELARRAAGAAAARTRSGRPSASRTICAGAARSSRDATSPTLAAASGVCPPPGPHTGPWSSLQAMAAAGHEQVVFVRRPADRAARDHRDPLDRARPRARRRPLLALRVGGRGRSATRCAWREAMTLKAAAPGSTRAAARPSCSGDPDRPRERAALPRARPRDRRARRPLHRRRGRRRDAARHELDREETPWVTGVDAAVGGSGDPSPVTAFGVLAGMRAACDASASAPPTCAAAASWCRAPATSARTSSRCSSPPAPTSRSPTSTTRADGAVAALGVAAVPRRRRSLRASCDVLAPCALGGVLHAATVAALRCADRLRRRQQPARRRGRRRRARTHAASSTRPTTS